MNRQEKDFLKIKQAILEGEKPYCYFRKVKPEWSFKLRKNYQELVSEISSIEELFKALEKAPQEAIVFHLKHGNDFAFWIREIIGHKELARELSQVKLTHPEETRWRLVGKLYNALSGNLYSHYL